MDENNDAQLDWAFLALTAWIDRYRLVREEQFRAHTDPQLIGRWLGPRRLRMDIDHFDARIGGTYRDLHTGPDGDAYGFSGTFHTVRENELIVQTFECDGFPDVVSLEFMRFEDLGGAAPA